MKRAREPDRAAEREGGCEAAMRRQVEAGRLGENGGRMGDAGILNIDCS